MKTLEELHQRIDDIVADDEKAAYEDFQRHSAGEDTLTNTPSTLTSTEIETIRARLDAAVGTTAATRKKDESKKHRRDAMRIVKAAAARLKKEGPRPCTSHVAPGSTYSFSTSGSTYVTPAATSSGQASLPPAGFSMTPSWVGEETGNPPKKPIGLLNNPKELAKSLMQHEAKFLMDIFETPIDPFRKGFVLSVKSIRTGDTDFMQRTGLFRMAVVNEKRSSVWISGLSAQGFRVVAELLRLGKPVKHDNMDNLITEAEIMASATEMAYGP